MIISQTSQRVSFVGGGSDFFDFYSRFAGKVCSITIDKYIYVLKNCTVAEEGTYEELIKKEGEFNQMLKLQMFGEGK